MRLLLVPVLLIALVSAENQRQTSDDKPQTPEPRDKTRDANDLALAKKVATQFAADIMKIRETEDILGLTNHLEPSMTFQVCNQRLYHGHFVAFITNALLEKEQYPTNLQFSVKEAYTRLDNLSMYLKAEGFIFEANDEVILDWKKQKDGSYKLNHGTILTCRDE